MNINIFLGSDEANCTTASVHKVHKVRVASLRNVNAAHKMAVKANKVQKKVMDSRKKFLKNFPQEMRKNKY